MASKFRIYSTEAGATLDPDSGSPSPVTNIRFNQDPLFGSYDPANSAESRGSVFKTLGGQVVQDFGVFAADERISFSDADALGSSVVEELETAYAVVDGEYYFTDGYNCWKVKFSRTPRGFKALRNLIFSYHGTHYFSYEINLIVLSKEI